MSLSTNPAPVPVITALSANNYAGGGYQPFYDPISNSGGLETWENRKIWLNGISIRILNENYNTPLFGSGAIKLQIKWDDYNVKNDVRWCADSIILSPNDFNINNYSLIANTNIKILIDQGLSPTISNGAYGFTVYTHFFSLQNSKIHLEQNSELIIDNNSSFDLSGQIDLENGSKLIVKHGSKFILRPGSMVNVASGARIIIEDDGILDYFANANLKLNGSQSVLEIRGTLNIEDNATFTFTSNTSNHGYVQFSNTTLFPSRNIFAGSNCKINLHGSLQNKKVLQIDQETFYAPPSLVELDINNGKVVFNSGSRLQADGLSTKIIFHDAKFTSATPGINNDHRGVHLYGQPNVNINNCIFEYGRNGIFAYLTYGGAPLSIHNSVFRNCNQAIEAYDKGIYLDNCFFYDNYWSITGSFMSFPSSYDGGNDNYNTYGLSWHGYSTPSFTLNNPYINHNIIGARIDAAPLYAICGTVSYNNSGFVIRRGASLLMDDIINQPHASYMTSVQNNHTIRTALANYLYLHKGYNDLSPTGNFMNSTIKGSFLLGGGPFPLQADANRWNTAGTFSNNDYYIVDQNWNPLTINDPHNLDYSTPCGQAIPPCPQPPCDQWLDALRYCPYCDVINTDDFTNRSLNVASLVSMDMINSVDSLNYRKGINLLCQILQEDYLNPDEREVLILNYDYLKLLESVGNAFLHNQITERENLPEICDVIQSVINITDKNIEKSIADDNYFRRFLYSMDKTQIYRIAGRRDLALSQLNEVQQWASDSDQVEVSSFICIIQKENEILNVESDLGTIQELISGCQINEMRISRVDPSIKRGAADQPEIVFSISPNPVTQIGSIRSNIENCKISIIDNIGKNLFDKVINYDVDIDFSNWSSGIYIIRFSDLQTSQSRNEKFIIK